MQLRAQIAGPMQTCNGSLGNPVISEDFGSGQNPGPELPPGYTNMTYTQNNCPNDGQYTIANSLTGAGNCHPDTWYNVPNDHTGNPNGYMMIVNASEQPSVFFTQPAQGLCPNTTYYFSAYIFNLITQAASGPGVSEPNITFSVTAADGTSLGPSTSTGYIPNTGQWHQYGAFFTTTTDVTSIVVTMTNNAPGGNGNDLILDDIAFQACGPMINLGFQSITGPSNEPLCQGQSQNYTLSATIQGGTGPTVYQWQSNLNNAGWNDVPGGNSSTLPVQITNAQVGTYQYRLGVGNGSDLTSAQCRVYSTPLSVDVTALPTASAVAPLPVCEGTTLTITASGGASYTWTGPNIPPTAANPLVINNVALNNAGTYSVVAASAAGCPGPPTTVQVTVLPKIAAGVNNPAPICAGESTQLNATGGTIYQWTPAAGLSNAAIANPVATPLQTTTYNVDISNGSCDDNTKSVTVTVNQNPVADAGSGKVLFEGQSAKLDGSVKGDNITSYSWSPATFLDNPNSLTPVTTPTDDITYTLTAVSSTCGTSTSSIFVRVYKKITIPNTFSPNNDGINDHWDIDALVTYPDCSILVFDRYGQPVYQSTGYPTPWDGTYKGLPVPEGTYYYIIDLKNGTPKLSGWVLLVR